MRHRRRKWRGGYGQGMSRVPRKIFWRRGAHFYWVGAEVSSTRGGRRAHPPRIVHFLASKKINKKESMIAFKSAIAATGNEFWLKKRYSSLNKIEVPIVISTEVLKLRTKEFYAFLEKILGENFSLALKKKNIRAGKGKMRGRKYKENSGLLLVLGEKEKASFQGIEIMKANELEMKSLFPLGRLTIYTEHALDELDDLEKNKEKEK